MTDIIAREMLPHELPAMLSLRNAVFGDVPEESWHRDGTQTAAVAFMGDQIVSAIPLSQRRFRIRPGQVIRTAFENAVGVREDLRGTGIGSRVIEAAAEFMKDRCDALMVYRGGERSAGYRFYQKTRHVDLHYIQTCTLTAPQRGATTVQVGDIDQFTVSEEEMLPVFRSAFGNYAGFPEREPGYWKRQMNSSIFAALPSEFCTLWLRKDGRLVGYALLATRTPRWVDNCWHIFEMAVENNDSIYAEEMMAAICDQAAQRSFGVVMESCRWHPYFPILRKFGFDVKPRGNVLQGQPLDFEAMTRAQLDSAGVRDLSVKFYTPERDYIVESDSSKRKVVLEMKDETLVRLLFGRMDLLQAVRLEQVTASGEDRDIKTLATVFSFIPWVYHELDYI